MQFLRVRDVAARTARSQSQLYKEVQRGLFPKPMNIGTGGRTMSAWQESEIERMMKAIVRGATNAELETVARQIEQDRESA